MQQSLSFLPSHLSVGVTEYESNSGEEITLARSIATDDHIVFWREWFNDRLFTIAMDVSLARILFLPLRRIPLESLDNDLLDMHTGQTVRLKRR